MKVTNNSKALQGVHTSTGVVYVKAGEAKDLELTADGYKSASRHTFLKIEGRAPTEGGDEKDVLVAKLKALGISAAGNSKVETLRTKLVEAEADLAKEKQAVIDELKSLNVEFEEAESLEVLKEALATAKA